MKYNHDYKSRFRILKGGKISMVVSSMLTTSSLCFGAPVGGVVTTGNASISQTANTTTITQSTQKASINWQSFSVAPTQTINFVQPNSSSVTLNRVVGVNKSLIDGTINANGQVFLLNPNGVVFSKGSSVNVGGLVASTLNMSDEDFQAGNYALSGESTNSILNLGTIKANSGGYVVLAGKRVSNEGLITATLGNVQLAGASKVTLDLNGNSLIKLTIDKGILDSLIENKGAIQADGGMVYLTSQALDEVLNGVVNNTGIIEADSLDMHNGEIILFAHGGTATIDGTLSAKDGFIETSGKALGVKSSANIQTKSWLLDPTNLTIDSSGLADTVSAIAVQNSLSSADVELQADEDITVNEDITWGEATKLTLTAGDEIFVNTSINNTNNTTGGVYFNAADINAKVIFDATTGKVVVNNVNQLQWINQAINGNYELGSNIDASATTTWNSGAGFKQIENVTSNNIAILFTGNFDGKGYVIDGLFINGGSESTIGLFGRTEGATISNIGLINVDITGHSYVGGLVGRNKNSTITNSYVTGSVSGYNYVGGLVGRNENSTITNSYATGSVSGKNYLGGLVGLNQDSSITNSYATGSVSGKNYLGGLVGLNGDSSITNSYTTGSVSGTNYLGGLVGWNDNSTITNSYWDRDTTGLTSGIGYGTSTGVYEGINSSTNTVDAFNQTTYAGFNFTDDWFMIEGETRPFLRSEYSTTITNDHQLQLMTMNLNADYILANDITYSGDMWSSKGFDPIGDGSTQFRGTFDGKGYVIDGLYINRASENDVGLFGHTNTNADISSVGLTNVDITGNDRVGGLAGGTNGSSSISNSYVTGEVTGNDYVGGLVGRHYWFSTIANSYTTVDVSGDYSIGGLVGWSENSPITKSYATGEVSGNSTVGGLVGYNLNSTITNSYWDIDTTGRTNGVGTNFGTITNLTGIHSTIGTIDAFTQATYVGFNFTNDWIIYEGDTRPLLRAFMTPLTVTANDATKTYDGNVYNGANGVTYSTPPSSNLLGTLKYGTDKNVGTYVLTPSGLYSNQQGYIISYVDGSLDITAPPPSETNTQTLDASEVKMIITPLQNGASFKTESNVQAINLPSIKRVNAGTKLPDGLNNDEEL